MQGQQMTGGNRMNQMNQTSSGTMGTLTEQDLFHTILVLLKHNVREYATAVTEANCPVVRQTMQRMMHETLAEQADCYQVMARQGWYPPAPSANRQDVQKSVQQHRQGANQTAQSLQMTGIRPVMGHQMGQPSWQNPQESRNQTQQWQNSPQSSNQWQSTQQPSHSQWQNQSASQYGQSQYQPTMQSGQSAQYSNATSSASATTSSVLDSALSSSVADEDAWRSSSRTSRGEMTH